MRLKRLEVYGYKSFATRSTFDFSSGITAIVGPNGSGKSNVADAVRWVLGEQSFRLLRAHASEDMIFAGTSGRSRLGMAEVTLTFDNADGWLPIEYSEVSIGRRAYRSGENEYLLNGNRVRYRDVAELLGAAGLARSSYLVIGQGMVDAALSLRPEARRILFEDAAGLAPHLRHRAESLNDIAETERNLDRAQDILSELKPRADMVRRQAERADEFLLLRQDLRELQRIWFGYEWRRVQRDLQLADERVSESRLQLEMQRTFVRECQERLSLASDREGKQATLAEQLSVDVSRLRAEEQIVSRDVAVALERRRLLIDHRALAERDIAALASRRGVLRDEIARLEGESRDQIADGEALAQQVSVARQALAASDVARTAIAGELATGEARLAHLTRSVAQTAAEMDEVARRGSRLAEEISGYAARTTALDGAMAALSAQGARLVAREHEIGAAIEDHRRRMAELDLEDRELARRCQDAEAAFLAAQVEHTRLDARLASVERMRQDLSGYSPGVRLVTSAESGLHGLVGPVATLMRAPKEYELAIEAALGQRLQSVVAETWRDAELAIALLKQRRAGWVTFLPLDALRPPSPRRMPSGEGIVGVGNALVSFDERLRPVFDLLLGRVLVVTTLEAARRQLGSSTGLIVTLEGDTVQPTGVLSGGTRLDAGRLLAQEREARDLSTRAAAAATTLRETEAGRMALRNQAGALRRSIEDSGTRLTALARELDAARESIAGHQRDLRESEREARWLEARRQRAEGEISDGSSRRTLLDAQMSERTAEREAQERGVLQLRERLASVEDVELRQRTALLETQLAVAQRTVESHRRLVDSHRDNLAEVESLLEARSSQMLGFGVDLAALAVADERDDLRHQDLRQAIVGAARRAEEARERRAALERERRDAERLYATSLERVKEAESGANLALLQRERTQDQRSAVAREVESDLGPIDLPDDAFHQLRLNLGDSVVELPDIATLPTGLTDDIRHLKARLRRLGDINADAPREYEQLLERQTFLQGQASDLKGAITSLHEVIQELDAIIARDFVRTVRTVDEAFRGYFSTLFGGGSARLLLTAPEQPDTTGVEIIAQPPGRRAQPLSLLSGGERALTAVALLFALLRANPVPFCFLDEVDAALDEANVGRFRDLLVDHARDTQFIVITHNRHTIDAASTIYGISMGEQGVSQTVSMRLAGVVRQSEPLDGFARAPRAESAADTV